MIVPSETESGRKMAYVLIAATIGFTVAGQLLIKAGMSQVGQFPDRMAELYSFGIRALTNFKVISGLALAVLAALTWMGVVSLSDISFAYPFMTLAIALVLVLSRLLLGESVPVTRWLGVAIVCLGLIIAARS